MTDSPSFKDVCEAVEKNESEPEKGPHELLRAAACAEEALMLARARKGVLESGDWLSAMEVGALSAAIPEAAKSDWKTWIDEGRIFAIRHDSALYFPSYALDADAAYLPYPIIASVIQAFGAERTGWGLAYWFASANGFLGGLCPKDLIALDPERVKAAAHYELMGITHG